MTWRHLNPEFPSTSNSEAPTTTSTYRIPRNQRRTTTAVLTSDIAPIIASILSPRHQKMAEPEMTNAMTDENGRPSCPVNAFTPYFKRTLSFRMVQ
ncbi:hypothetical protein WR25_15521 [Diploscapter pachys]|uniref:Uncharacterized protein n=1 Tax=Diploscapter pachys TaxID=2018661 RepID=A0A2A2KPJ4_9BILA|nr:hypothetical protein WR25_15521 [Diploscapter pachys]